MVRNRSRFAGLGSDTTLGWIAFALVLVTGGIHVYAGHVEGRIPVLLAGIGFLGAAGIYLLDYRRPLLYLLGILYTSVQIPLWYEIEAREYTTLGYADKVVQVALVVLLVYLYWISLEQSEERAEVTGTEQTG